MGERVLKSRWKLKDYRFLRQEIIDEINDACGDDFEKRLGYSTARLAEYAVRPDCQLISLVWINATINAHLRHQTLGKKETEQLIEHGETVLKWARMKEPEKEVNQIAADFYYGIGELSWLAGQHSTAQWQQAFAYEFSRQDALGGPSYQAYTMGLRTIRLGHVSMGMQYLSQAEQGGLTGQSAIRCRLNRIIGLRIMGNFDGASDLIHDTEKLDNLSTQDVLELDWEKMWLDFAHKKDFKPIVEAVKGKNRHASTAYACEARLLSYCVAPHWRKRLASIESMIKQGTVKTKLARYLHRIARILDDSQSSDIPLSARAWNLGDGIDNLHRLYSLDQEVIGLAAITNRLTELKLDTLASVARDAYGGLNLKISGGVSGDPLGLLR